MSKRHSKFGKNTRQKETQHILHPATAESQLQWNVNTPVVENVSQYGNSYYEQNAVAQMAVPYQAPASAADQWSSEQNNNVPLSQEQMWTAHSQQDAWNWQPVDGANQAWGDYSYQQQISTDPQMWAQQQPATYYSPERPYATHWQPDQTGWQHDDGQPANYGQEVYPHGSFSNFHPSGNPTDNSVGQPTEIPSDNYLSDQHTLLLVSSAAHVATPLPPDISKIVENHESFVPGAKHIEKVDEPNQEVPEPIRKAEPPNDAFSGITEIHTSFEDGPVPVDLEEPDLPNQESPSSASSRNVAREGSQPPLLATQHSNNQVLASVSNRPESVNLETEPDNLEKPPSDVEDLRRQQIHLSLHGHHHYKDTAALDSTTLWESPDIPCVTFLPSVALPSPTDDCAIQEGIKQLSIQDDDQPQELKQETRASGNDKPIEPSKADTLRSPEASASKRIDRAIVEEEFRERGIPKTTRPYYERGEEREQRFHDDDDKRRRHRQRERYYYYDDREEEAYYRRPSSRSSEPVADINTRYEERGRWYEDRERAPSRLSETEQYYVGSKHGRGTEDGHSDKRRYGDRREHDYYRRSRGYDNKGYDYEHYPSSYYSYFDPYRSSRYSGNRSYDYGFYDELYRMDPRYREQMEQYSRAYYGNYVDPDADRLSLHSSHGSIADEFLKDKYGNEYDTSSDYSGYNHNTKSFNDDDEAAELYGQELHDSTPDRLTPFKFTCAHPVARFSAGQLIQVVPSSSSAVFCVEIHDLQHILKLEDEPKEMSIFPGPLVRGQTHKNDVIHFCNEKIKDIRREADCPDRESQILLWELLILLLRQNGSLVGSDIAELLLKGREELPTPNLMAKSFSDSLKVGSSDSDYPLDASSPDEGIVVSQDKTVIGPSVEHSTRKFREYLLYGHKKDALEWAIKNGLWGHALFLASKMDARTYASVMTRFANSLALNDPLQTLYQLMSGRQPAAVTNVLEEKWGDWRPHLSMILSNPSPQSEVDRRSITTLGDTLAQKGSLAGSHFCYLMAQVDFGSFEVKSSKLVLLGSSHLQPFEAFSCCKALQCTEIYEYAQSLANPCYALPHLQPYKFLYATRLAEQGFLQEAVHYCEVLSGLAVEMPSSFSYPLLQQIYELGSKLKFHDPCFSQTQDLQLLEQSNPTWLQSLLHLILQHDGQMGSEKPSIEMQFDSHEDKSLNVVNSQNMPGQIYNPDIFASGSQQEISFNYGGQVTEQFSPPPLSLSPAMMAITTTGLFSLDATDANAQPPPLPVVPSSFDYYGSSILKEWKSQVNDKPPINNKCLKEDSDSDPNALSSAQSTPTHRSDRHSLVPNHKPKKFFFSLPNRAGVSTLHNMILRRRKGKALVEKTPTDSSADEGSPVRHRDLSRRQRSAKPALSSSILDVFRSGKSLSKDDSKCGFLRKCEDSLPQTLDIKNNNIEVAAERRPFRKRRIVFGGTFPIDEPVSVLAKESSCTSVSTTKPDVASKKNTFPIDVPCCVEPRLCRGHSLMQSRAICCNDGQKLLPKRNCKPRVLQKQFSLDLETKRKKSTLGKRVTFGSSIEVQSDSEIVIGNKGYKIICPEGFSRERQDSIGSLGRRSSNASTTPASNPLPPSKQEQETKKKDLPKKENVKPQTGRSWLGGIFGKFLPKGQNQMILPDDKNPAIVWDEATHRWIDINADGSSESALPQAPPTDMELKHKDTLQSGLPHAHGSNKFHRPKMKGMSKNYVDIFKASSGPNCAPVAEPLENNVPAVPLLMPSHLLPAHVENDDSAASTDFGSNGTIPLAPPDSVVPPLPNNEEPLPSMFDPAEFSTSYNVTNVKSIKSTHRGRRTFLR